MRQQRGRLPVEDLLIEERGNQLNAARSRIKALTTERPTAIPMSGKLRGTELNRRRGWVAGLIVLRSLRGLKNRGVEENMKFMGKFG